ncbi:hypothetical protein EV421DRAFT_1454681 [Armillaria borealis]|uniref:Uncharacterized protein n=1 Tax=Armillaria borealis TaxID=47425 RepID=A0AA39MGH6_9AGAR|nr:hypothetical protein EV421DRAFT_1454681 [Armillaria borealis]
MSRPSMTPFSTGLLLVGFVWEPKTLLYIIYSISNPLSASQYLLSDGTLNDPTGILHHHRRRDGLSTYLARSVIRLDSPLSRGILLGFKEFYLHKPNWCRPLHRAYHSIFSICGLSLPTGASPGSLGRLISSSPCLSFIGL